MSIKKSYDSAKEVFEQLNVETTLGKLIRALRETDEITQVSLAKKLKVSRQFLSDVEHDRKSVGLEFAKKLSNALGYPVEMFVQPVLQQQVKKIGLKNIKVSVTNKKSA